jgi:hypothetical protein
VNCTFILAGRWPRLPEVEYNSLGVLLPYSCIVFVFPLLILDESINIPVGLNELFIIKNVCGEQMYVLQL